MGAGNLKHLIAVLFLFLFVGGIYFALTTFDYFGTATQRASDVEAQTAMLERDIFEDLDKVNKISLKSTLFENEAFKSLKDIRVELDEPVLSRTNPFDRTD